MEQQQEARNLITFLLTIVSIHFTSSSNQNVYTIDIGTTDTYQVTDHVWLQPLNTTTSSYQESTTYLPVSTSITTKEILDSSETNAVHRYTQPSYRHSEEHKEADNSEEPSDHVIAYSEHEEARDVPTRPKYVAPGIWAKPPPDKNIPLDFVPKKLHAQVRGTHVVKKVPQREAIESAETDEEKRNAHRLREVVTNSKVNTVYTEEGYEDSAYDHAGHVRDADFHEGFARKLHDEKKSDHHSSSGQNKEKENDEFKDYKEDYKDHLEESRKVEQNSNDEYNLIGYGRNAWKERSEIDPKLVIKNGIRNLEEDIEKDAEETERSSQIYQKAQESKHRDDVKTDSSESEESRDEDDLKDEENKPTKSEKKGFKLKNGKANFVNKGTKQSHGLEKKKLHENHEMTVIPFDRKHSSNTEIPASLQGFVTNPSSLQTSVDQTTLRYVAPTALSQIDEPTTISYSQMFWDYFKARQTPSSTESSARSSTANSRPEERKPIAVATIDGHGPYLLVTQDATTTSPSSTLFDSDFGVSSAQAHNRHLLGRSDDVNYVDNVITASTTATFTTVQPLILQSLSPVNPEDAGYSTTFPDVVSSSTTTVMTLNMTKEAFSQIGGYKENPFLSPILDNSNIVITKNKIKYKVLVRPEQPKKVAKPTTDRSPYQQPPSSFEEEDDYGRIRDELNAKYNKMLNHINNKQKSQSPQGRKKIIYPEDLTLMRPPSARQVAHSIFPINRPSAADHSSDESESSRETNWRNPLQDQHHPQSIKLHVDPYIRSAHLPYYKNSLPSTKLLPPPPPPSIANIYGNYRNSRQSDNYPSHTDGKPQPDNAFRYLPLAPEASWRTRSRRKRSDDEGEFRERSGTAADVKAAAANNTVTNDGKSERLEGSFSRVTDRPKGKSASRGIIDRLASPARSRAGESGTSATLTSKKNNTVAVGESENAEDARETATGDLKATKKSISEKPNERKNDTSEELSQKKRNVSRGERRSKNLKNRADEKDHEELLNESPKISGDVIDKEIAVRFNDKDDNKTSSEIKEKGKVETDVPSFDYVEELAEDSPVEPSTTTEAAIDWKKYPFYNDENVPSASALKYIVDPKTVPRKTSRGMEFYDSRNAYKQCDAVEPSLDKVLPEKEEPDAERGPQEDLPHLRGLGDKLDCLKAKYFDENPLDSPLFAEKLIADPTPPSELNSTKFASQILALPQQKDDYVVPRVSKKPERDGRQLRNRNRAREAQESIRINYKYDPQTGRGRNAYMYTVRNTIPHNAGRRVKSRITRPRSSTTTTTQSPKKYQIASYQNQVYEDVMGNIRHLANQIHEKITLSPATQILETAGSENSLQIVHITPSPPKEKTTSMPNVTEINATNSTKSSEIKGLLPPPKYVTPRQSTYRKHRPPSKSRISLLRAPSLSRIIAHHHAIKIKKRSTTNDITNFSESVINETAAKKSAEIDAVESSTIVQSVEETTTETNSTPETIDLEIAESKQNLSTLKVEGKKRRKNSTSDDQKSESSPRIIYTIRDRIRHSKPKWNAMGFGKFNANSRTVDEDNRRKEPRYNQFTRKKKPVDDQRNNSASLNSTDTTEIESATSLIEGEESSLGDVYRPEESAMRQMIYRTKNARREPKKAESVETESEENAEKETESTTNSYEVRENIDDVTTASSSSSKAVQDLKEYLESDPPGYAETFPEEATTTSSKNRAKHEEEDEDTDYPKNAASPWSDDSSEKAEEQVETPIKTELPQDDDSEEVSSKEEEGSNKEQTFFTYRERPSSAESDRDDERSEKASFYSPFPFSKYKSMIKEESDESEEGSEDYVFPWHADEKDKENKYRWLQNYDRFEYPWERRERLAKERQRKQKRANRIKELFYGDKNEEESTRRERPIYPWEKYDVPSKSHVNARRDVSRRNMDDREETSTERLPFTKFSSRYSSSRDIKPRRSSTAREISRSIKKFLEDEDESKEETSRENKDRFSSRKLFSDKEIPKERKSRKRKNPQANKKMSNNTRFDSNGLRSREAFNEAEKEATTEYIELNKTNESESQAANRLSNGMTEIPSMTGKRKKRRRKISQNNSTIPPDSTPAESITESTKRRRKKPQASTTTSATPAAIADLDTSKSIFIPVQRKYSKTDEAAKKSELKSPKWTITPETSEAENLQVKTSTPKTRTIEHRSRISKEKIMRKTIYPDERENFDSTKKNVTVARKEPMQKLETNLKRRKKNNNEQNANNKNTYDKMLIKQRGKENDSDIRIADGEIKKLILIEKTQDKSKNHPLKNLEINKEEVKKINDASIYDGIINDENGNDSFRMPPETYAVSNLLLQNIPPNRVRNDQANERTGSILRLNKNPEHNSGEEREEDKEKRRLLLQSKFIKDPERRLYYYVDRK